MHLNADFRRRAAVEPHADLWQRSPAPGVERLMLDRVGDEVARATSIVRYAAGSSFSRHEHAKGEEFLVLEGVFSDESGDYPAGTYVRNPPGSGHAPFSEDGCRIFVKLRQFDPADLRQFALDTNDADRWHSGVMFLHEYADERVEMRRLESGDTYQIAPTAPGTEILLVGGALSREERTFSQESWLRFPAGDSATLEARGDTILWVKTGHLPLR